MFALFSVQQIERVISVVDEVHPFAVRANGETEQGARSSAARVDQLGGRLHAGRCRFDKVAIAGIHRENVLVRSDREAQGLVQASTRGDGRALSSTGDAKQ